MSRQYDVDDIRHGSVSLWHPWQDKPGFPRPIVFMEGRNLYTQDGRKLFTVSDLDELVGTVAHEGLYVLCHDLLSIDRIPYLNELLGLKQVTPYLSRTGGISAILLRQKKRSGFLINAGNLKWDGPVEGELCRQLERLFTLFGFQSTTLSSLSEKVLRATLPAALHISR